MRSVAGRAALHRSIRAVCKKGRWEGKHRQPGHAEIAPAVDTTAHLHRLNPPMVQLQWCSRRDSSAAGAAPRACSNGTCA